MRSWFVVLVGWGLSAGGCVGARRAERAASRVDLGAAYIREGNPEAAISTFEEASRMDPRNWRAPSMLALAYAAKGQAELAEQSFERAIRLNPVEGEILLNYGAFLLRAGRTAEAAAAFEKALGDLDYRNVAAVHSNLALALVDLGRSDDALRHAREAVRRAPTLCEGWFHLGLVQEARKDAPSALEAYQTLIDTCPDQALGGRLRTGCIHMAVGMVDEGEAELRAVAAAAPSTALADEARACLAARP